MPQQKNINPENQATASARCLLGEKRIKLCEAMKDSSIFAIPFAVSRLAFAIQNFAYGYLIQQQLPNSIAAAPVMFMLQQSFTGSMRGALSTVNVVAGELNGKQEYKKIGAAINQGLLLGTLLGIPVTLLFYNSKSILINCGTSDTVATQAGDYLRALSFGIIPTNFAFVDQNFLLSIKRTRPPILLNTLFVVLSLVIGAPLAYTNLGLAGLGYGATGAAIVTFAVGRYYLFSHNIQVEQNNFLARTYYQLFSPTLASGTTFCQLLCLSFPTAMQAISEWLPTMLISLLSARTADAQIVLEAQQPSMQSLIVFNTILLGLGTAATVSVANALGKARSFTTQQSHRNSLQWQHNARTIALANIIVTGLCTLPPACLCLLYPEALVSLFGKNTATFPLAKNMLRFTGLSLILDGIRNTTTGALLGNKKRQDNFMTSITNLLVTSVAAIITGYSFEQELGPISFFLFRMIGISVTAFILLAYWNQRSKVGAAEVHGQLTITELDTSPIDDAEPQGTAFV